MNTEAVSALKLANSYLDEVVNLIPNPFGIEPGSVNEITKTLDLAGKQLDKAEKLDPAVTVTHEVKVGTKQLDVKITRATIYLYKGLMVGFGKGEKTAGAKLIEQCIAMMPAGFANAHFALAVLYADLGRKSEGIQNLRRAMELEPDNIEFQKLLGRLEDESGLRLRIGAFRGSWKVLLVLCALAGLSLIGAGWKGLPSVLLFGCVAGGYWWWKSR